MERFWIILSMTTGFYTKNYLVMKFSLFSIKSLISPLILAPEYRISIHWGTLSSRLVTIICVVIAVVPLIFL